MMWLKACTVLLLALHIGAENLAQDAAKDAASQDLSKRSSRHPNFFTGTSWYNHKFRWCGHAGSQLFLGDFNGDGRTDLLCHDKQGRKWVTLANARGVFTGATWHNKRLKWCGHAGSQLLLGDFNGDRRTDMLCHDNHGRKWIMYASRTGTFVGGTWHTNLKWCGHRGSTLLIGDFNGDGRDDMLCHDKHIYWVSFAQRHGRFYGTSWQKKMGWCSHPRSKLHVGDFNRDKRVDLLCHDIHGNNWVMLASHSGKFNGRSNWAAGRHRWCSGVGEFFVADFNGDKRADRLCHARNNGYKWITIANPNIRRLFTGTTWHKAMGWCGGNSVQLFTGDFNGDGKADMLCHGKRTGHKWIAFNHYKKKKKNVGKGFKKLNKNPVCFQARGNRPGMFNYYGPSRIVKGLLLVYRSGHVTCHYHNKNSYSRWGCGGVRLNVVVTDQYNYVIYPRKQYIENKSLWYRLPGKHSKSSRSLFFSNAAAPFYLTQARQLRIWYGEDLTGISEGANRGRVCADVYGWFA